MTDDSFAAFYALYPRHVARKAAERAWAKLKPDAAVVEQIMAGLRAQLPQMITKDKSFIPHASTWLNGERWKDDHIAAKPYPRVIECAKCGDTGVVSTTGFIRPLSLIACTCARGQAPGLLVGPIHAEDAL